MLLYVYAIFVLMYQYHHCRYSKSVVAVTKSYYIGINSYLLNRIHFEDADHERKTKEKEHYKSYF